MPKTPPGAWLWAAGEELLCFPAMRWTEYPGERGMGGALQVQPQIHEISYTEEVTAWSVR